jgi:hypothetical protein
MKQYIVIFQSIIGGGERPFVTDYSWDGEYFNKFSSVKKHGLKTRDSDDFNIGHVKDGKLIGFYWMDEEMEGYDLDEIADSIGL